MAYTEEQDEEDDELEEDFGGDDFPEDVDGDDLILCPQCRASISALCDMCPRCGHWIMETDKRQMAWNPPEKRGMKVAAAVVFALIVGMLAVGVVVLLLVTGGS